MKAIEYRKSVPRFLAARALSSRWPSAATGAFGTIALVDREPPRLPSPHWVGVRPRLAGICGSDLATITASGSAYFSPLLSYPFVLGHEVVGDVTRVGAAVGDLAPGDRVVLEPALGCAVREIEPHCRACARGDEANCENVTRGVISAGIQTGFCRDTGGAWSGEFVAHRRQLHRAPADLPDEALVLCEPFACAIHAALAAPLPQAGEDAIVLGCGSIGLLVIAALRALGSRARVIAIARHAHQEALALALGADLVVRERGDRLLERVAAETHAEIHRPEIGGPLFVGGAAVVYDCVGSSASIDDAVRFTRARGHVAVVGMPGVPSGIDWTAIWYKEIVVRGCYAYGLETWNGERARTFELALRFLASASPAYAASAVSAEHARTGVPNGVGAPLAARLESLVGGRFKLASYREAIGAAINTSRAGWAKTVFDFRGETT